MTPWPCKGTASGKAGPDLGCAAGVAMQIALIYNPASGRRVSLGSLRELIEGEGHELVRVIEHASDSAPLAEPPAETPPLPAASESGVCRELPPHATAPASATTAACKPNVYFPFGTMS